MRRKKLDEYAIVPVAIRDFLTDVAHDSDGWWYCFTDDVYFYGNPGQGIVHEDTLEECAAALKDWEYSE